MYNNVNYNKISFPDKNIKIVVLDGRIFPQSSDLNFKLFTYFFSFHHLHMAFLVVVLIYITLMEVERA